MSKVKFSRYDTVDYLKNEDDITAYLDAAVEDGDPALITAALDDVARTHNQRPEMDFGDALIESLKQAIRHANGTSVAAQEHTTDVPYGVEDQS